MLNDISKSDIELNLLYAKTKQAVMRSSPIVVALATFTAYVLSGHQLDAQTAFTSLALFGTIAHPFHVMPKVKKYRKTNYLQYPSYMHRKEDCTPYPACLFSSKANDHWPLGLL